MTQWHPQPEQLVEFAAGSCHTGVSIAVSVHLHYCAHCRRALSELESASSVLFEAQAPAEVSSQLFDTLMQRIQNEPEPKPKPISDSHTRFPRALMSLVPDSLDSLTWSHPIKNLRVSRLMTDESGLIVGLHHMKAGGRVPNHRHRGEEISVVLEGGYSDRMGSYGKGDFVCLHEDDTHAPQADADQDCLMLSVVTAPVKLTGPLGWLVNPFLKA